MAAERSCEGTLSPREGTLSPPEPSEERREQKDQCKSQQHHQGKQFPCAEECGRERQWENERKLLNSSLISAFCGTRGTNYKISVSVQRQLLQLPR